jgi:hypothetical protein
MAKANTAWKVLPHGPVEELAPNLLRVEGALEGMPLKRVMAVARRADGKVVVHNGIALEDEAMKRIEALGQPAFLVVPNGYHRLDAPAFKARYPSIQVVAPRGSAKLVSQVVKVDMTYDEYPSDADVRLEHLAGTRDAEGVMIVRSSDGVTLVFNDIVFNMPHLSGFQGFILRHVTRSSGGPRVSRIGRLFLVKDKRAVRSALEQLASTPGLTRVLVAHHETIATDPANALRAAAATLGA